MGNDLRDKPKLTIFGSLVLLFVEWLLPAGTDCFIQAGSVSKSATADDNEWRLAA